MIGVTEQQTVNPEPIRRPGWQLDPIIDYVGKPFWLLCSPDGPTLACVRDEDTANRIIACLNYCEGAPTGFLQRQFPPFVET